MIKDTVKKMSAVLKEMLLEIFLLGLLFQFSLMWFAESKGGFTLGLWVGIILAGVMTLHMNHSIERMLELPQEDGAKYLRKTAVFRMLMLMVCFLVLGFFNSSSGLGVLLGILALKLSAYLQPLIHKLLQKFKRKGGC